MRWWVVVVLVALAAQEPTGRTAPADSRADADKAYREGVALLERGEPGDALVRFDRAVRLLRHPKILVARAGALADLGRLLEAADAYEVALAEPGLKPDLAAFARGKLDALVGKLTVLTIEVDGADAEVSIDGGPRAAAPVTVRVLPGAHAIDVSAPGRTPARERITTRPGERTVSVHMGVAEGGAARTGRSGAVERVRVPPPDRVAEGTAPAPVPVPAEERAPRRGKSLFSRWYFWAGVGTVVVGGALIAVLATRDPGVNHVHGDADLGEATLEF